jgi:outer membrane protein assembly factor BamB
VEARPVSRAGQQYPGSPSFAAGRTRGIVLHVTAQDYPAASGNVTAYNAATGAGRFFVNSDDGNMYALDDTTGTVLWKFAPAGGDFGLGSPAYANGVVYMIDSASNLYALNAKKGTVIWEDAGVAGSDKERVVANGVIYAPVGGDGLSAFDASNGNRLFSRSIGCFSCNKQSVVVNGAVYQVGVSTCGGQDALAKWALP